MPAHGHRSRSWTLGGLFAALAWACLPAPAQSPQPESRASAPASADPDNSSLDAPLFYQLLIGEIELNAGHPGSAYEVVFDAAKRTRDESLFRRAVDIALQGRAGEQALEATKAWRQAAPNSIDARRYQLQILLALNRADEAGEPYKSWLALTPPDQRSALIAASPRLLQRMSDRKQAALLLEQWLTAYRDDPQTRTAARVAQGRMWLAASDPAKALQLAQQAAADDPQSPAPMQLAIELMPIKPEVESMVVQYLAQPTTDTGVRLSYVAALTRAQRYAEAAQQLDQLTQAEPNLAPPWLTLGALRLDMKQPREAETALKRYVELVQKQPAAPTDTSDADADASDGAGEATDDRRLTQAWLLLAQIAEQRGDLKAAEAWLAKIDDPKSALDVQSRRASLLARQGQMTQARELIRRVPERNDEEARAKVLAEVQLLREFKRWREAVDVMTAANKRFADDADLLYEQAMLEDKLDQYAEMERLLQRVIQLKPDNPHAHNALGYSLADRSVRLPEAKALIQKAMSLAPGDPFIVDSMGWVEFRMGNRDEALRWLRQAYAARPDTEIAAHLGEVLWATGKRDEARRVWQDARGRDSANEVLKETLARLKVNL
ncbi:MAG TPA: tetratricopeptide repeat protein [Burkholderiaceae bacterium]|nr:tetratricopeptide repeat protein [Burkholderiaceae bacterium]